MRSWPEIRDAATIASVFHIDPAVVLEADPVLWKIRLACAQAALDTQKETSRPMRKVSGGGGRKGSRA